MSHLWAGELLAIESHKVTYKGIGIRISVGTGRSVNTSAVVTIIRIRIRINCDRTVPTDDYLV